MGDDNDRSNWGKREDGTAKGGGWLGVLKRKDGGVSTEISVGTQIGGVETEIPALVPTLSRSEIKYLLDNPIKDNPELLHTETGKDIMRKARTHAMKRIAAGKSPFANGAEEGPGGDAEGGSGNVGILQ